MMESETWQARGVEIDNNQVQELMNKLDEIIKAMHEDTYGDYLLACVPVFLAQGLTPEEAKSKAHDVAYLMPTDG